jgi:hypothetical protein
MSDEPRTDDVVVEGFRRSSSHGVVTEVLIYLSGRHHISFEAPSDPVATLREMEVWLRDSPWVKQLYEEEIRDHQRANEPERPPAE